MTKKQEKQRLRLVKWFDASGLKTVEISRRLGCSLASIYHLRHGYWVPGLKLAIAIEDLTEGAVKARDWV